MYVYTIIYYIIPDEGAPGERGAGGDRRRQRPGLRGEPPV